MKTDYSVLYVEDDAMSRQVMEIILRRRMKIEHITIMQDSTDFLHRALAIVPRPELVLLDINMRPLDGFDMLRVLRCESHFSVSRIVAMTASVMHSDIQRLQSAGFDGCIAKPVDKNKFPQQFAQIMAGEQVWSVNYN